MAWYSEKSVFSYGKYKGKKVSEVDDANYIDWLHHSNLNVYFKPEVLDRLKIVNKGKNKDSQVAKLVDAPKGRYGMKSD